MFYFESGALCYINESGEFTLKQEKGYFLIKN